MAPSGYALFETPIGRCGIAWTPRGVAGVSLPDAGAPAARARLSMRAGGADEGTRPESVARAVADITALLSGEPVDLSEVALDDEEPPFHRSVYAIARAIPPGRTLTYGEVAAQLGGPQLARAVGQALGRNPWPIIVPCHRVLAASGRTGGFSAPGRAATKLRMLTIERASTSPEPLLFDTLPLAAATAREAR